MNRMKKATLLFAVFLVFVVGITLAVIHWEGTITWGVGDFTVWDSATLGTELTTPWRETLIIPEYPHGPLTYDFYLENDGDVEITVVVAEDPANTGCLSEWSDESGTQTTSWSIPKGDTRVLATLTLTINAAGSYDFDFDIAT